MPSLWAVSAWNVSASGPKSGSLRPASVTVTVVGPVSSGYARLTSPPRARVATPMP